MKRTALILPLVVPLLASASSTPVGSWHGERMVSASIRVIDEASGEPVVGARIWLLTGKDATFYALGLKDPHGLTQPIEALGVRVFSGLDGVVTVPCYFDANGPVVWKDGGQKHEGQWYVSGRIQVTEFGFDDFTAQLEELVTERTFDLSHDRVTFEIKLKKKANKAVDPTPGSAPRSSGGLSEG